MWPAVRDHNPDLGPDRYELVIRNWQGATPHRAWVALSWSLRRPAMACAIPHRAIEPRGRMSS